MGTVLEAMSAGKPVITTQKNGNEDIIVNNVNGILIPPESVNDIVKSVCYLLDKPTERESLGKNAQKYIQEYMTWDIHCEKLLKILKETITKTRNHI
jgi:glycosyltransferase involved in cell wall biosynthesis